MFQWLAAMMLAQVLHALQGRRNGCEGGGYNFARSGRENFFWPPPTFGLPGVDMKQDIAVFFTAIMTSDLD